MSKVLIVLLMSVANGLFGACESERESLNRCEAGSMVHCYDHEDSRVETSREYTGQTCRFTGCKLPFELLDNGFIFYVYEQVTYVNSCSGVKSQREVKSELCLCDRP